MNGSWLDRNRNLIFVLFSVLAVGGAGIFYLQQPDQAPIEIQMPPETATATLTATPALAATPTPSPVRVYITGAVANSDVYVLPSGSIVKDVIASAGGLKADADIVRINQALELKDQQHIHIPRVGEEDPPPPVQGGVDSPQVGDNNTIDEGSGSATQLININTATKEELDALPGIGPAIAQRIIDYRENSGRFTTIEEITQVSGIGEVTFSKIKELIIIE